MGDGSAGRPVAARWPGWLLSAAAVLMIGAEPVAAEPVVLREITAGERDLLFLAEDVLMSRCMAEHGLRYEPQRPDPALRGWEAPHVIDSVEWARVHGLGLSLPARASAARRDNPNNRYLLGLPEDQQRSYMARLYGPAPTGMSVTLPSGGVLSQNPDSCQSRAQDRLYGDVRVWFHARSTAESLLGTYARGITTDPRYVAAQRDWAGCMSRAGHPASTPAELRAQLGRGGKQATQPQPEELAAAVAEATCAQETGFGAVSRMVYRERRAAAVRPHQQAVDTHLRLQLAALRRADLLTRGFAPRV
ncbi:hypothetical protein [Longispora albida]|uniref:hypothetical protein n=1 Tax=Longispora albida TaxID=203523 RepID=UPI000361559B|nr:hypothetical protein [Longispora albida]